MGKVKKEKAARAEDECEDEVQQDNKKPASKGKQKDGGLNYTAIGILLMFTLPMVIGGVLQLMDYMNPEAAKIRKFRERVVRCYEAANPSKLSEVDDLIAKYQNKEHILFAKLRGKYEKFPECSGR